ncbi:hypothetical protein DFH11DRAFT_32037 [Phellopilus nigrolimitatus]|nr:hypothetical protein DFH11DRAFT_32037 [Phellopilus nigrolimitatus]
MIFNDGEQPVKFFVQRDLPEDVLKPLEGTIEEEGGRLEERVPIRGYIVIQPGTAEAERLCATWQVEERPHRYFVPYTWVEACKQKGRLIRQIFVDNAFPVKIHIHKTIANVKIREEVADTISIHGGNPDVSEEEATVILASSQVESYRDLRKEHQGSSDTFVENLKWLETCVKQEHYYHSPNQVKNPGGRRPGDERTAFTEEDEANLCNWIAAVIPYKESGGRTGNKIYQDLIAKANMPGFEWVERHTWQSWRERYKKNAGRLDQHIAAVVLLNQNGNGGAPSKAQFGYFRLTEGKNVPLRRPRRKKNKDGVLEDLDQASQFVEGSEASVSGAPDFEIQEGEWNIREGTDPPPNWGKRPASDGVDADVRDYKRSKTVDSDGAYRTFMLTPTVNFNTRPGSRVMRHDSAEAGPSYTTTTEFAADFGVQGPAAMHPVDHDILAIAQEYQFTAIEVRDYYDRTRDMVATRQRFERMRVFMNTMP